MAKSPLSLFILSILFFSNLPISESKYTSLIYKTCKNISKEDPNISFNFCSTSLQSRSGRGADNLRSLGLFSIVLLRRNVTNTRHRVEWLLGYKRFDPFVKACLDDCLELYSDAIPTVKRAARDYVAKRYDDANSGISAAMDAATTCEDGFKEKKGVVSPLTKRNGDAFELGAIVLAIMSLLQ
ncbi:putative invertase inhibitor [Momordica charantia]|uniref:Invertase inhibitor n=1 Tax=Momordica charantia TaxID=3673 RepID=A0A6J1DNU9_MOMCH|nr:putative invertase inhibitor [Momordica charantia]